MSDILVRPSQTLLEHFKTIGQPEGEEFLLDAELRERERARFRSENPNETEDEIDDRTDFHLIWQRYCQPDPLKGASGESVEKVNGNRIVETAEIAKRVNGEQLPQVISGLGGVKAALIEAEAGDEVRCDRIIRELDANFDELCGKILYASDRDQEWKFSFQEKLWKFLYAFIFLLIALICTQVARAQQSIDGIRIQEASTPKGTVAGGFATLNFSTGCAITKSGNTFTIACNGALPISGASTIFSDAQTDANNKFFQYTPSQSSSGKFNGTIKNFPNATDPQDNWVMRLGYNTNAGGGREDATEPVLNLEWESHYEPSAGVSAQEFHLSHTTVAGVQSRPLSFYYDTTARHELSLNTNQLQLGNSAATIQAYFGQGGVWDWYMGITVADGGLVPLLRVDNNAALGTAATLRFQKSATADTAYFHMNNAGLRVERTFGIGAAPVAATRGFVSTSASYDGLDISGAAPTYNLRVRNGGTNQFRVTSTTVDVANGVDLKVWSGNLATLVFDVDGATGNVDSAGTIDAATGFKINGAITDDTVMVNNGTATELKVIGDCDTASSALTYDTTTNAFGCNSIAGGSGDAVSVAGVAATDANFIDFTSTGTEAGVDFTLDTAPAPDTISGKVAGATGTTAGVVTTGAQTFAGVKTFSSTIVGNIDTATTASTGDSPTDFFGTNISAHAGFTSHQAATTDTCTATCRFVTDYAIPANALTAGMHVSILAQGLITTDAGGPTPTFSVEFCTVEGCATGTVTAVCPAAGLFVNANVTNGFWRIQCDVVVVSAGAAGSIEAQGTTANSNGSATANQAATITANINTAVITLDTTVAQYVTIRENAALSGDTVALRILVVKGSK